MVEHYRTCGVRLGLRAELADAGQRRVAGFCEKLFHKSPGTLQIRATVIFPKGLYCVELVSFE